ncbi:MAG TPA: FkbM family methyltransferase [Candidatus Andersenbacteria bacterium]|nr:FkbM family methyltransferase [Candidatus Andersenbacteria bacterium]
MDIRSYLWHVAARMANIAGSIATYLPHQIQAWLIHLEQKTSQSARTRTLRFIFFHGMLKNCNRDIIVKKDAFHIGSALVRYTMELNLKDYVDRRYYFLNENEDLGKLIVNNLSKNDTYFDIGANIGHTALLAATVAGKVVAFEPEPAAFQKLTQNLARNGFSHVAIHNIAASDTTGSAQLFICKNNDGSHSMDKQFMGTVGNTYGDAITVSTRALNDMDLPYPTFVKIDVEGHEASALRGMSRYLPTVHYVYCETSISNFDEIKSLLSQYGFTNQYALDKQKGTFVPVTKEALASKRLFDILFVNTNAKEPIL